MKSNNLQKLVKNNSTAIMVFVVVAVLFSLWLSNNSCRKTEMMYGKREYMGHKGHRNSIEHMGHGSMKEHMGHGSMKEHMDQESMQPKAVPKDYWETSIEDNLAPLDFQVTPVDMKLGSECAGGNAAFVSSNLLPKSDMTNEVTPGLEGMNLLETSDVIGIDTISNTNKNANYSLRSEPPNPKTEVSPWLNSTIEPDPYRTESII